MSLLGDRKCDRPGFFSFFGYFSISRTSCGLNPLLSDKEIFSSQNLRSGYLFYNEYEQVLYPHMNKNEASILSTSEPLA